MAKKDDKKDFFSGWTAFFIVALGFVLICFAAQKGVEYFQGGGSGKTFSSAAVFSDSKSKPEEVEDEDIKKAKQMKAEENSDAENNSDKSQDKNKSSAEDANSEKTADKNQKQPPKPEDEKLSIQDKIFISNQKLQEGKNFVAEGKLAEALESFDQAVKLYALNAEALTERGKVYTTMQNFEQALRDFNKAVEVDSTYADAYTQRGLYYQNFGDDEKAQADLATAQILSQRQ